MTTFRSWLTLYGLVFLRDTKLRKKPLWNINQAVSALYARILLPFDGVQAAVVLYTGMAVDFSIVHQSNSCQMRRENYIKQS